MAYFPVLARDIKVGDIVAPTVKHSLFSVKSVHMKISPRTRVEYILLKGPLGMEMTLDPQEKVNMIRHT